MFPENLSVLLAFAATGFARQVSISVDASNPVGSYDAINGFFGCDEPNYAYYPEGQAMIKEIGALGKYQTYFRTHNLLTTGQPGLVGVPGLKFGSTNAYTEDSDGNPIYNFTIIDQIFDSYLAGGVKPYLEVGFMPLALATNPYPYFFNFTPSSNPNVIYTGWSHVPTSYQKWEELVYQWANHCLERYGEDEVNSWYFEIWNEPNIPYWNGTTEQFYMLHDHAITGIRRAIPSARVGGAEVAGGASGTYLGDFIEHCLNGTNYATNSTGTPLDFVSFHAKGAPIFVNTTGDSGYIQMNVSTQLQQIDQAFGVVASYPELENIPVMMSEYDPDSCAACTSAAYSYRNGLIYPSYTAASFTRAAELARNRGVNLRAALTWAFEYETTPLNPFAHLFDEFRVLSTQGIDKAIFNVHRMFAMISGDRLNAVSDGQTPIDVVLSEGITGNAADVGVLASLDSTNGTMYIFVWHYHDKDLTFPDADVTVTIDNLPDSFTASGQTMLTHYRIDDNHSNPYPRWLAMGSPLNVTEAQYSELVAAGKLATLEPPRSIKITAGESLALSFSLPIRAISLLVLQS